MSATLVATVWSQSRPKHSNSAHREYAKSANVNKHKAACSLVHVGFRLAPLLVAGKERDKLMPKTTFPIMIEVEEIALGSVLRKLNDMPGIAKLHLNLGRGGEGAGRKPLEDHAAARGQNGGREPIAIKLLMQGPKHISEISAALGGAKSRAYGLTNTMSKKGIVERADGAGMWRLTKKAMAQLGKAMPVATPVQAEVPALPAPGGIKRSPSGRAAQGSGPIILRAVLGEGPARSSDLRRQLAERGMSSKSISGVLDRGRKYGLIKRNGSDLYELTAKGMKIELGASAHG